MTGRQNQGSKGSPRRPRLGKNLQPPPDLYSRQNFAACEQFADPPGERPVHSDPEKILSFYPRSGFLNGFCFQGCTRFAVKLDFICGLVAKTLHATGGDEFRGNQAMLGEMVSWRNLFWSLSECMASNPQPWVGEALLPNLQAGLSYRVFAPDAYSKIKEIIEKPHPDRD
ncbi:MAG: 4-hydroxyphenylacetate 3-hydroxylase C-terminal domain-containing protein [Stellaceae bacterium]